MKFDEIVTIIGEFGKVQKILYGIICIPCISGGIVMTLSVISLGIPRHRCKLPNYPQDTYKPQDSTLHQSLIQFFIPLSPTAEGEYDKCHLYSYDGVVNITNMANSINTSMSNATLVQCSEWVYDDTDFTRTMVTKLNLVCDNAYKVSTAQSLFFSGVLIGALFSGILSDKIGRKKTFCFSMAFMFLSSLGLIWVPTYAGYIVLRVLNGVFFSGTFLTAYVIGVEIVGTSMRLYTGILNQAFFAFGMCFLAGVGYFVQDWVYIQAIIAAPMGFYLFYYWIIPESPRWLINEKRFEEAKVILIRGAKINKVELPPEIFATVKADEKPPKENLLKYLCYKKLLIRSLIIFYNWMVVSMVYYGLTLNSGNIGGNVFLNFFIAGAVEFPAYVITILLLDRLGRRKLHCLSMVVGGVACLLTIFTILYGGKKLRTLTITLSMIGKLGSSAGFAIIYIFSAELFPTSVRNAGIGASSASARIGGMIAPMVAALGQYLGGDFGQALPLIIFGTISVIAGFLALFLPETLNVYMPETIADALLFGTPEYRRKFEEFSLSPPTSSEASALPTQRLLSVQNAHNRNGETSKDDDFETEI